MPWVIKSVIFACVYRKIHEKNPKGTLFDIKNMLAMFSWHTHAQTPTTGLLHLFVSCEIHKENATCLFALV